MKTFYEYTLKDIEGAEFNFEELRGKVVLIVNTASKCGFTPQFEGLQKLHEKYKDQGLMILGFPSNDFLFQDPGTNNEIKNFCLLNYGVDFRMFEKIHVRGSKKDELYAYLMEGEGKKEFKGGIKWNFTKFLINQEGGIVGRYAPNVKPEDIENEIAKLVK